MTNSAEWSAICHDYDDIRRDAHSYELGTRWKRLVEDTRKGRARLTDWSALLDTIDDRAEEETDLVGRGDALRRRVAAIEAASGNHTCPGDLCTRQAPQERAGRPPVCPLLNLNMALD